MDFNKLPFDPVLAAGEDQDGIFQVAVEGDRLVDTQAAAYVVAAVAETLARDLIRAGTVAANTDLDELIEIILGLAETLADEGVHSHVSTTKIEESKH